MIDFDVEETPSIDARRGVLSLYSSQFRTPTYIPNLIKRHDREKLVLTINTLLEKREPLLPHTGAVLVEAQNTQEVLGDLRDVTQRELTGELKDFTTLQSVLDKLNRGLIIDPNTDRILFSAYRSNIEPIKTNLPNKLVSISREFDKEDTDIEYDEAYHKFKKKVSNHQLSKDMIDLQRKFDSTIRVPPYYSIDAETVDRDLKYNVDLYKKSKTHAKENFEDNLVPVISIRNSILKLDSFRENGRLHPPKEWGKIINKYRDLDPDLYLLKATNAEIDPDWVEKPISEGILEFFKLFRRYTGVPAIFLGLDEFAFLLTDQGLDGYSHPVYQNPYRQPKRGGNSEGPNHRKFLRPRKGGWVKFDQLETLGCNGPFCEDYNDDISPSEIPLNDQDDLRKCHWYWLKDEQMRQVYEAIGNGTLRPGLDDVFSDSEWRKNLLSFLSSD